MSTISAGTTSTTTLIHSGDTTGSLVLKTNDTGSGGTTAVTIDTSQNVGIGTTSPAYKLDILTGGGGVYAAQFGNGTAAQGMRIVTGMDSTSSGITTGNGTRLIQFDGTNNVTQFYTNASERMRIDSSGNVGIGTSSPATELQLYKNKSGDTTKLNITNPNDTGGVLIQMNAQTTSPYQGVFGVANAGGYMQIGMISSHPIQFITNSTERMRIDSSGNLLMNTTGTIGGSAGVLQVKGQASSTAAVLQIGTDGQNGFSFRNSATTQVGTIVVNTAATAYNTSSDYRLKENIAPMTGALAKVSELKPVTYTWKSTGEAGEGFIAHELQTVVPDCVTGEKDAVDAEGNPVYQGIDTSFLVATLTAAIQEQQALITQLQADVATLKGQA